MKDEKLKLNQLNAIKLKRSEYYYEEIKINSQENKDRLLLMILKKSIIK